MSNISASNNNRTVYFDYLRVLATFSVIILHVSAQNWDSTAVNGFAWQTFNFFDSIVRWCVPVFVMISGALFLNRNIPIKKIYSKYVLRMATSFAVWSFIYALVYGSSIGRIILRTICGYYHMWFILMIIGIYICIPVIKIIANNLKTTKYYLILFFAFACVIPWVATIINDFIDVEIIKKVTSAISDDFNAMNMSMVLGYAGYFILGYYLNKVDLNKKARIIIYAIGGFGFVFTVVASSLISIKTKEPTQNYYGYFSVNALFESVAIFTLFKYRKFGSEKTNNFIAKLSKYSFGIYLIHVIIIDMLGKCLDINTLSFNPIASVIVISVIVFIISCVISAGLNHIPFVKKYMV